MIDHANNTFIGITINLLTNLIPIANQFGACFINWFLTSYLVGDVYVCSLWLCILCLSIPSHSCRGCVVCRLIPTPFAVPFLQVHSINCHMHSNCTVLVYIHVLCFAVDACGDNFNELIIQLFDTTIKFYASFNPNTYTMCNQFVSVVIDIAN